ncbi:MAG TPA: GTP-binding protein [Chitinophagaceae bacterium]|nr:GTP-binding protein [Chitinophagaceae bacterium]
MKLFLVGGFLGSGKTTAIAAAAKMLAAQRVSLAVITNDQGSQLVDSAFMDSLHIPASEVKNGCFCCNYDQFYSTMQHLKTAGHPDIIFAEAAGSCADLVATIVKPLSRFDPHIDVHLSIFADGPVLLSSLEGRSSFVNDNIQYIYKKQLEEAGIIVINKIDLLTGDEMEKIESILGTEYPGKKLLFQDSRSETSIEKWLRAMDEDSGKHMGTPDIDYKKYGAGEAALAWLDASFNIYSRGKGVEKAQQLIEELFSEICFQRLPIAHLKFFLQSGNWRKKFSYTSNKSLNEDHSMNDIVADHVSVIVNARVETSPDQLKKIFCQSIKKIEAENARIDMRNLDSFQPGYPKPTHRLSNDVI